MSRVAFLVDGFNVYHSLRDAERVAGRSLRWLDLRRLCESYARRNVLGRPSTLQTVTYFSAFATFLARTKPDALARHATYVRALQATGVEVALGRFKARSRSCPRCGSSYVTYEEKETDVAIAIRIMGTWTASSRFARLPTCDISCLILS